MKEKYPKKNGPWQIHERVVKYKNRFGLTVYEDKVTGPDGSPGIFGFVEMGKGSNILAIDKENNVYLGTDFQYPIGRESLEIASGGTEDGESPLDTAKRELKEELGITGGEWIYMGIFSPMTGRIKSEQHMYVVRNIEVGESDQDSTENIKLIKMSLEEAVKKVMTNEIHDGLTSTLIMKAHYYLQNKK